MKAQRVARCLAQHTSTPSSLFSTTSSRAARHRAWLTASSLRHTHRTLTTSRPHHAPKSASAEVEAESESPDPDPTLDTNPEPLPDRPAEPILPPAPSTTPIWGAPKNLKRRTITPHNATVAALMGSTTRSGSGSGGSPNNHLSPSNRLPSNRITPRTASKGEPWDNFRVPRSSAAIGQEAMAIILENKTGNTSVYERIDAPPPVRVDAFMGRAAVVNRTTQPLAKAIGVLNGALKANQIKEQLYSQRFHERPGLRRKRLKSERWRKRFMVGFKHMVAKVREMKAQGW